MQVQVSFTWRVLLLLWLVFCCWALVKAGMANGEVRAIPGANLPLATLGMFILWMGWFFNGGSTLKLGGIAVANKLLTYS